MKKFVFIVLCFSIISVIFCKDNSTNSKSSKKSNGKDQPGLISRILDKVVSTVTSVTSIPIKLTWKNSIGLILTPLSLPIKLISKAATDVQEIFQELKHDVKQAMRSADEDLNVSKGKSDSNNTSGSNDKNGSDDKSGSNKNSANSESKSNSDDKSELDKNSANSESKSKSDDKSELDKNNISSKLASRLDEKSGSSDTKSRRRRAIQLQNISNQLEKGTVKNETFNVLTMSKKLFQKSYDLFTEILHQSDDIGNSMAQFLEKIFLMLKYVKPVYLYFRDQLLPSTIQQLIKAEHSPFATKKVIHRIDNIKEGYKLLELLGYVPSLNKY